MVRSFEGIKKNMFLIKRCYFEGYFIEIICLNFFFILLKSVV